MLEDLVTQSAVVRSALASVHPLAPAAVLSLCSGALVYAVRRWLPQLWLSLERIVPEGAPKPIANTLLSLPTVAFGAAAGALASGGDPSFAALGALSSALAPVGHHLLRWLPVPYQGAVRDAAWKSVQRLLSRSSTILAVLLLTGCAVPLESARREGVLGASPATSEHCQGLDSARITWGAIAKGAAIAAGASGVSALPFDDKEARVALASAAVGAAVVGAVAVYVSEGHDAAWARECSAR